MTSKLTIVFLSVFLLVNNISAKSVTPKKAKEIFDKASKLQKTRSYTATTSSGEGKSKISQNIFQKLNPDGTTYERIETKSNSDTSLFIKNDSGQFDIFENLKIALKSNFEHKFMNFDKYTKYSLKGGSYQGIPCYIIRETIKVNDDVFQEFITKLPDSIKKKSTTKQLRDMFNSDFSPIAIYYVGKNNFFIYSSAWYTARGKLSSKNSYKTVNLNPKLNDSLFEVPAGLNIQIANDIDQYLQKYKTLSANINKRVKK